MSANYRIPDDRMCRSSECLNPVAPIGSQGLGGVRFARREFLRFVAGSPLLLFAAPATAAAQLLAAAAQEGRDAPKPELLASPADAINVFDFEAIAQRNLSPAHYTYLSMGVQDEFTLRANREAFGQVQLRPRRLVDVRKLDTSSVVLGTKLSCPIVLAPAGSQKANWPLRVLRDERAISRFFQPAVRRTSMRWLRLAAPRSGFNCTRRATGQFPRSSYARRSRPVAQSSC
jgi:hypothetical protein